MGAWVPRAPSGPGTGVPASSSQRGHRAPGLEVRLPLCTAKGPTLPTGAGPAVWVGKRPWCQAPQTQASEPPLPASSGQWICGRSGRAWRAPAVTVTSQHRGPELCFQNPRPRFTPGTPNLPSGESRCFCVDGHSHGPLLVATAGATGTATDIRRRPEPQPQTQGLGIHTQL